MDNSINESSLSAREHLLFNERDNNLEHLQREMNKINWDDLKQAVKNFRGILQSYHSNKDDWNIFCKSKQEEGYSRNEIIVVPNMYSLVLMVWKPFKGNFIHDHGGSHGLVKILQGRLVEEHYSYHQEKEMGKRLEKENEITLEYNEVNDHNCFKDFHRMYNPDAKEVAVSLHVYAPPLEKCRLINNESNDTEVVQMKCTSRRGEMTTLTENNELSDDSAQVSFGERKSPVSPDVKCRVYEPESKSSYNIEPTLHTADGVRRRQKKPKSNSEPKRTDQEHKIALITKSEKRRHHTVIQTTLRIAPLWLSLIAFVLALTVLVVWCIGMRAIETKQDFQRKPKVMQYSRFCFKCALLGDYPDHHPKTNPLLEMLNNLTRHKIDDHNSECCVENDEQFKSLVAFLSASLIIKQESSPEKSSSNNLRTTPVSAHKQLEPAKNLTDKWTTDFPLMLNTSYHDLSYEHVRGVDVTDEGFIVKFSGLYFVYASIQFNCTLDVNVFNKTLYHYLDMTKKPTRSIHLLRSVHTICQGCMQSQDFAGIFYIESGAKIHMSVSAHGVVNYPAKSMYMGLAMLTNQRPLNHNRLKNKQKNSARSNPTVTTMTRMKFSSSLLHTK